MTERGRIIPLQMMTLRHMERARKHCAYNVAYIDLAVATPGYGFSGRNDKIQKGLSAIALERMYWLTWCRLFTREIMQRT